MAEIKDPAFSRIMQSVTKNVFEGHDLQGRQLNWWDDQHWYETSFSFYEPRSMWGPNPPQGCELNIYVVFKWAYSALDFKQLPFRRFENETQFESDVEYFAEDALKSVLELRNFFSNIETAEALMLKSKYFGLKNYHLAIICGLNNSMEKAREYFDLVLESERETHYTLGAAELKPELDDLDGFRKKIDEIVANSRNATRIKQANWPVESQQRILTPVLFAEADKDKNLGSARKSDN